jgi:two-component system alkaline phosphatase synthesis response regulator PhoP
MIEKTSPSNFKILIVDDDPDIVEFIRYNTTNAGYQVFMANDGLEALEVAETEMPDLILLDIMMPKMDGVEVCQQLRADTKYDNTIIAFLTARSEDYSQVAALDYGGDDYITKPILPKVLMSRIKALLRRKSNTNKESKSDGLIQFRNITIDSERFLVKRDGENVEMVKKEFELLKLLASKPGKVFTREEIFAKVWGFDVIVGNRTIDVHIRKIREKLGDKCIKTVKGIGYKLNV